MHRPVIGKNMHNPKMTVVRHDRRLVRLPRDGTMDEKEIDTDEEHMTVSLVLSELAGVPEADRETSSSHSGLRRRGRRRRAGGGGRDVPQPGARA